MNPHAAKHAHIAQAMALVLAAAMSPDTTQPSAGAGDNPSPVAVPMQGTGQRRDEGNDEKSN